MANILVVEDEKIVAADIHSTLVSLGYWGPGVVSSGEEAVRRVAELHPDLVLVVIVRVVQIYGVEKARLRRNRVSLPGVFRDAFAHGGPLNPAQDSEALFFMVKRAPSVYLF